MKCDKYRDIIITDYVDGELDEQGKQEIDRHLRDCSACRAYAAAVSNLTVEPLRKAMPVEPPAFLWTRIKSRLAQEPAHGGIKWLNTVATFSMFVVMALAGNYLVSGMLGSTAQQEIVASAEVSQQLSLTEFNDMPNEQVETVYNSIIGG
ncbi:MAG: zf-HC2 domain-containing protein [bacterium]|nr:zf-HC2 domain-containing protein [bacterium]MDD5755660.1 zf-HC2 domain-containing protein [bacterium]